MTTLFISDLHLQENRPEITRAFFQFLDQKASQAHQLYILGDFFEVWIGDDGITPFHREIIEGLNQLSSQCNLFFMHGNRDFLIGERFADLTNAVLLNEPTSISLYGTSTLLLHGDSLCTEDKEYMAFRNMVRNPDWQHDFLSKPLAERITIAKHLREKSQQETANKEDYITDVTESEVIKVMTENHCPLLIHGHTHRPARHRVTLNGTDGERIVLGDWDHTGWYVEASKRGIALEKFIP